MPNTPCNAFLQPHVRPVAVPLTCGARLIPGTKVGVWRVEGDPIWGPRSATYSVALFESEDRAVMTVFDAPALHLGSYPRRILSIAQRLATVEHPAIASVVDAGLTADGRPYVVTDLDQAVPLKDCMTDMELSRALTILRAICAPLLAAHDLGIAHGSLELDHVFLIESDARYVKLIDWGIERAVFDEAHRAGLQSPTGTTTAPEAALGLCSPQMDAYALGAIAARLVGDDVPSALGDLIEELMADDPRQRPSMRCASDRLAAIQHELEAPPVVVVLPDLVPVEDIPVPVRSGLGWRRAVACAALAAAGVLSYAKMTTERHRPSAAVATIVPSVALPAVPVVLDPPTPVIAPVAATPVVVPPAPMKPRFETAVVAPPKVIAKPVVAPPVVAKAVVATPVAKAVVAKVVKPRAALDEATRNELLAQYQRLGRALFELQAQRGVAATSELMQQFKDLKIEPAMATHESREAAAARLGELRQRLERQRGVDVADACLKNALADGCR